MSVSASDELSEHVRLNADAGRRLSRRTGSQQSRRQEQGVASPWRAYRSVCLRERRNCPVAVQHCPAAEELQEAATAEVCIAAHHEASHLLMSSQLNQMGRPHPAARSNICTRVNDRAVLPGGRLSH